MTGSREPLWLGLGGALLAVAVGAMGGAIALDTASKVPYSLWTSPLMIIAYITSGFAVACFTCAVFEAPLPHRHRVPLPQAGDPQPEPLQPRYDQSSDYRHPMESQSWITEHRVGVFNPPGATARRVRMHLVRMDPYPRNILQPQYQPVIPYAVPLQSGGDPRVGLTIGPGQEEAWIIGYTGTGSDGNMNAGGFAVPDQRWRGLPWRFDPDERWRLYYQIVCDDRPDVDFSIVVTAADGQLRCDLQG